MAQQITDLRENTKKLVQAAYKEASEKAAKGVEDTESSRAALAEQTEVQAGQIASLQTTLTHLEEEMERIAEGEGVPRESNTAALFDLRASIRQLRWDIKVD